VRIVNTDAIPRGFGGRGLDSDGAVGVQTGPDSARWRARSSLPLARHARRDSGDVLVLGGADAGRSSMQSRHRGSELNARRASPNAAPDQRPEQRDPKLAIRSESRAAGCCQRVPAAGAVAPTTE
jgi:hypothetical protein